MNSQQLTDDTKKIFLIKNMFSHKSYLGQEIYIFFCKVTNSATTTITNSATTTITNSATTTITNSATTTITNSATTTTLSDGKFVILVLAGNMKNNDDEECQ